MADLASTRVFGDLEVKGQTNLKGRLETSSDIRFTGVGVGSGLLFNSTVIANDAAGIRQMGTNNNGELEFFTTDDDVEPFVFRHYTSGQDGSGSSAEWFRVDAGGTITANGNIHANGTAYFGGNKEIVRFSDGWLRLNPVNAFTSGIYCNTGILRTDGQLQVGVSGSTLLVHGTALSYKGSVIWHAGNDGSGSGLDADTWQGLTPSQVVRTDADSTITAGLSARELGVNNTSSSSGKGLSLYSAAYVGAPAYGLMFSGTATFGTHGKVLGDWATYFTMAGAVNRGWIFKSGNGAGGNVASISAEGKASFHSIELDWGAAGTPFIDFHSGATPVDYDARIIASGGSGVIGNGILTYTASHHKFQGHIRSKAINFSEYEDWNANNPTEQYDALGGGAAIVNDNMSYKCLMILGNRSAGGGRLVKVWDELVCTGNITANSDVRFKTNIKRIDNALEKVTRLGGYTFDRTDVDGIGRQTGVIAQEVLEVLPEAVTGSETYSVAYGNMVGLLIEAIKELKAEIDNLKTAA